MYETRNQSVLPRAKFLLRVASHFGLAFGFAGAALFAGVSGYHYIAGQKWVDSLLNASMILGGMGPVDPLTTDGAKIFASLYALFSGLVFIGVLGVILAPFVHRVLHKLHVESESAEKSSSEES